MKRTLLFTAFNLLICFAFTQNLLVTMSSTPACSLDGTASATVSNGTPPYTYLWYWGNNSTTTTTGTLTGLAGGWISVQVTDANNLVGWGNVNVTPPFTLNVQNFPDTCSSSLGASNVSVNGGTAPYTYAWSNGATTTAVTGLLAGQYDVTVFDAAGCRYAASDADSGGVWIWDWSPISVNATSTPSSCVDGTATANPTQGTAPYTYYWYSPWNATLPVQTTQTATNLPVGALYCKVTDATGCVSEQYVYVQQGVPAFTVTTTKTPELCATSNGSISTSISGSTGPYTYNWSNGATTPNISGLAFGVYGLTITDANGCPVTKNIYVPRSTPMTLSLTEVDPGCGMTNGSVTANPGNGTAPYTYLWSNGATTQTVTGLGQGWVSVNVTDANGCTKHGWANLEYASSCYGTISGTVYQDNAGNCTSGSGNPPMPNVILNDGPSWTMTNSAGQYSFSELPGTFTISQTVPTYHNQLCPSSPSTISATLAGAGAVSSGNDFYNAPIVPVQDLRVSMMCNVARPGFNQHVTLKIFNDGTVPVIPTLTYTHDAQVTYNFAVPAATNYISTTQTATWNYSSIPANGSATVHIYLAVPATATLGSILNHTASVDPVVGDSTPLNNVENCSRVITGSYDPNDKAVSPEGLIDTDELLKYTIRFQNTGTDTAFTVILSDTLSNNLDISTFREGVGSHDYDLTLHGNGIMQWRFDNILLPDSNINEPASHGFVTFYIKPKDNLFGGDQISNTAAIYFDFNAPIITNTVTNTIDGPVANTPILEDDGISLYPNPSQDAATVSFVLDRNENVNVSVFNLHGQQVFDSGNQQLNSGEHQIRFSTSGDTFSEGIYLVKVSLGSTVKVKRLAVTH